MYRNYDYENDLDEYDGNAAEGNEENGGLNPEDEVLMREGTTEVQNALGPAAGKVTVEQIQEALWHYYFDVDKSVVYLMDKFIAPKTKPKKQPEGKPSRFRCASLVPFCPYLVALPCRSSSSCVWPCIEETPLRMSTVAPSDGPHAGQAHPVDLCQGAVPDDRQRAATRASFANFFSDMPWLNIPKERQTVFIPPPPYRGGLLGGSGAPPKVSKLQALAAARKKKAEDRKSGEEKAQETGESLGKLSLKESRAIAQTESAAKRRRLGKTPESTQAASPKGFQDGPSATPELEQLDPSMSVDGPAEVPEVPEAPLARPSAFAQTILGSSFDSPGRAQLELFQYPYLALSPSCVQDAFAGPSPDDKVLAAQAKGSLSGKAKK